MDNKIFYILVSGFTLGIFISSFFKMGFSFFIFLLLLSAIIFIFGYFLTRERVKIILLALFIFSFGLGILRYEIKELKVGNDNLSNLVGDKIVLTGVITEEPAVKDKIVQLIITTDSEKVLVSTDLFPVFKYG